MPHLSQVKFAHWDEQIRLLAAKAAANLAPFDAGWVVSDMLPSLIAKTLSADLKQRHGATHMIAETILGLCNARHAGSAMGLAQEMRKQISEIVPAIEKASPRLPLPSRIC